MADLAYQEVWPGRTTQTEEKIHTLSDATEDKININSYILAAIKYPEALLV